LQVEQTLTFREDSVLYHQSGV